MMDKKLARRVFLAFFRSSFFSYGGGPSSIPLIYDEVVKKYNWMTNEEFSDILALANTLPGPINTKLAGYIGHRMGGISGLLISIVASVLPTVILLILLFRFISVFRDSSMVQGMTDAVTPVIGAMITSLAYSFIKHSKADLGWSVSITLGIGSLIVLEVLNVHPALLIGILLLYAVFGKTERLKKQTEQSASKTEGM